MSSFIIGITFFIFVLITMGIGIFANFKKKESVDDYLLASRSIGPKTMALSAVSSCNSGFMFIGLIGFTYLKGISTIWLLIAWIIGDYLAWISIYKPLRIQSEKQHCNTLPSFIGTDQSTKNPISIKLAGIMLIIFLSIYASAQLKAGAKAVTVFLDISPIWGVFLGAVLICIYCFSGGIRASVWTDVFQSIIMLISMVILAIIVLTTIGGWSALMTQLGSTDPQLVHWVPTDLKFGFLLYFVGWLAWGIGVVGQPHIVIRPMMAISKASIDVARRIYFIWYILFSCVAFIVGLSARVLLPGLMEGDIELALPSLSIQFLPDILIGIILAGIFSACVSTADSQIISCSSSFTQDIFTRFKSSYLASKIATLLTLLLTLGIVLSGNQSVFSLVIGAWSLLAGALGPLILLRSFKKEVPEWLSVTIILSAFITQLVWRYGFQFSESISEVLPSFIVSFFIYGTYKIIERLNLHSVRIRTFSKPNKI